MIYNISKSNLPTKFGNFDMYVFQKDEGKPISVLATKELNVKEPLLIRAHSKCLTGDTFGSLRCDCGEQLRDALQKIYDSGNGMLIYLDQEGRGIGIYNKIRAYKLQDKGLDTYDANVELGFAPDLREYPDVLDVFKHFNISKINLITNNPDKISYINERGIEISNVVPSRMVIAPACKKYMDAKKERIGHIL